MWWAGCQRCRVGRGRVSDSYKSRETGLKTAGSWSGDSVGYDEDKFGREREEEKGGCAGANGLPAIEGEEGAEEVGQ